MLMAVAKDIRQFLAVLMVILIAFTYSFFLLLKDSVIEPGVDSTFEPRFGRERCGAGRALYPRY